MAIDTAREQWSMLNCGQGGAAVLPQDGIDTPALSTFMGIYQGIELVLIGLTVRNANLVDIVFRQFPEIDVTGFQP